MEHAQIIPEAREGGGADPEAATASALPRRRRGRTTLLIAGAAVLGVLAGTVTGYAVQYDREPTPLPPLAQPLPAGPKALAPDDTTTNKTINANRWHKTDDDLAKLLVEAPGGAKSAGTGYEPADAFAAQYFTSPDRGFTDLVQTGFRRVATTVWSQDDKVFVKIRLLQFQNRSGADDYQSDQSSYMADEDGAGNAGVAIPGVSGNLGHVWVNSKADEKPGYLPVRGARAIARRGDVVMDIDYYDNRGKIAERDVIDLAKRQLERL
ncbi:hypothetical protein ACIQF5_09465 [Streptomyces goshikiensis]|uniref:hypothetical protein n=1 Tax=Streptomyces goshikiensis TaxID=1942 RepID=UPI00381277E6